MKKYLLIIVGIVAVIAAYFTFATKFSNVSIVRVTKNCPTNGCKISSIFADGNVVQLYFAETGAEPVQYSIPNYLNKEVSNKVISNSNECFRFALGEIQKKNYKGFIPNYNGLSLKWESDDEKGTNSILKIWSIDTPEPESKPEKLVSEK
ncbi:MAG: hypothetical protein NT007_14250 [Candidatus Kapabacteria bacterium]|nr:hypothetical protein [Candidatus Kapabacteria bacterium]